MWGLIPWLVRHVPPLLRKRPGKRGQDFQLEILAPG
jgi:hypothetical protein